MHVLKSYLVLLEIHILKCQLLYKLGKNFSFFIIYKTNSCYNNMVNYSFIKIYFTKNRKGDKIKARRDMLW